MRNWKNINVIGINNLNALTTISNTQIPEGRGGGYELRNLHAGKDLLGLRVNFQIAGSSVREKSL